MKTIFRTIALFAGLLCCAFPAIAQTKTLVFSDTFTRADTANGGVGNGWVDASSKYRISNNTLTSDAIPSLQMQPRLLRPSSEALRDAEVDLVTDGWQTGTGPVYRVIARYLNPSYFYIADLNLANAVGSLSIKRLAGGVTTQLASITFPIEAGKHYRLALTASGISPTSLIASVIDAGTDGLSDLGQKANLTATDSTASLQAAGVAGTQLGYYIYNQPGSSGIGAANRFEVYQVSSGGGNTPVELPANDPRVFYSPFNWAGGKTNTPGAYLKTTFFGTSFRVKVDTSSLAAMPSANYPRLAYSVDNKPYSLTQLAPGQTELVVASGIADGAHSLHLYYYLNNQTSNIWGTETVPPENYVKVTGFVLDPLATIAAPSIRPKRLLIWGDSITRSAFNNSNQSDADSRLTYVAGLAASLDAEYGVIAHAGWGWNAPIAGGSNIPSFLSGWQNLDSVTPIDFTQPCDYITIAQGRNGSVTTSDVAGFLAALRAKVGTGPKIALIVPFAGTNRSPISTGFTGYQASAGDARAWLIDTNTDNWFTGVTIYTIDGIHPNTWAQGILSALLAGKFTF